MTFVEPMSARPALLAVESTPLPFQSKLYFLEAFDFETPDGSVGGLPTCAGFPVPLPCTSLGWLPRV
jgi:hypothetical protein